MKQHVVRELNVQITKYTIRLGLTISSPWPRDAQLAAPVNPDWPSLWIVIRVYRYVTYVCACKVTSLYIIFIFIHHIIW